MPPTPPVRRRVFWIGLAGLGLVALIGATAIGWSGFLMLGLLYVAVSAGWGILTARTWWGRTPRGRAAAIGSGALVAVVVVAGVASSTDPDPAPTPTATVAAEPSVSPSDSATPAPMKSAKPTEPAPTKKPKPTSEPGPKPSHPKASHPKASHPKAERGTALAALATLDVKGRAPKTGYEREQFGPTWADVDHNGCDTRNDILDRDLTHTTYDAGTHGCVVRTGRLADPYTATAISFTRGVSTSLAVQIDHVVALSDAWQKGAQQIGASNRELLANDPLNLLAVDGPTNASKSDGDAATWLPPNKGFRCAYVARQVAVKQAYDLWVTPAERDAIERVLAPCPGQKLPGAQSSPHVEATATAEPAPEPTPEPTRTKKPSGSSSSGGSGSTYYENCDAARAAGAAPVHRGDPGYDSHLDRDGDGVGCE